MYPEFGDSKRKKKQEKRVKKGKKKDSEISDHSGQTQIMDDGFRRRTAVWGWSSHRLSKQRSKER